MYLNLTNSSDSAEGARPAARGRIPQLDFLRGIAVLLVLLHHCPLRDAALGPLAPVLQPLIDFGWSGVTLFFVLSGFLVGGLLFKEAKAAGRADTARFLIRRAFKIWPAYFAFIGFCFLKLLHRGGGIGHAFLTLWPNLLQVQNYIATPPGHTWSLAVEEHFYFGFAIFIAFLLHGRKNAAQRLKIIPWVTAGMVAICLLLRLSNWNRPFNLYTHAWETQLCAGSLFLGVFLAYVYYFRPETFHRWTEHRVSLFLFAIALNVPMFSTPRWTPFAFTFGDTLMSLGFACLLVAAIPSPLQTEPAAEFWKHPAARAVAWMGVYSYSIYLWHGDLVTQPLFCRFGNLWKHGPPECQACVFLTLYFGGAAIVGVLLAKLIEFPALRLRDRWMPSPAARVNLLAPSPEFNAGPSPLFAQIAGGIETSAFQTDRAG